MLQLSLQLQEVSKIAVLATLGGFGKGLALSEVEKSIVLKNLLLNDIDDLNLEYRYDVGFQNFFTMNKSNFKNILSMIAPIIIKQKERVRHLPGYCP